MINRENASLLKKLGYSHDQTLEIVELKFNFEVESGRNIEFLSAVKLYNQFRQDYMKACAYVSLVDEFHKIREKKESIDWIIDDLTTKFRDYKELVRQISKKEK